MGEFDLGAKDDNRRGFDVGIEDIQVHPKYEKGKAYFDAAVIQTKPIELSPVIQPICLPQSSSPNGDQYSRTSVELIGKNFFLNLTI